MIDKQTEGNEHQLPTSCIKHWGLSGNLKLFCPASAFATADREVARNPQRFIHVTVTSKRKDRHDIIKLTTKN